MTSLGWKPPCPQAETKIYLEKLVAHYCPIFPLKKWLIPSYRLAFRAFCSLMPNCDARFIPNAVFFFFLQNAHTHSVDNLTGCTLHGAIRVRALESRLYLHCRHDFPARKTDKREGTTQCLSYNVPKLC